MQDIMKYGIIESNLAAFHCFISQGPHTKVHTVTEVLTSVQTMGMPTKFLSIAIPENAPEAHPDTC